MRKPNTECLESTNDEDPTAIFEWSGERSLSAPGVKATCSLLGRVGKRAPRMMLKFLVRAGREAVISFPKMEECEGEMILGGKEKLGSSRPTEHPSGDNQ